MTRACPHCRAPHLLPPGGTCPRCGGAWLRASEVDALAPGRLAQLRRLVAKGPLTHLACADCGGPMKSLDVPGHAHEGDLFWGHESPRPAGTAVAEGCPRCGGVWVAAHELDRAGGERAFRENLARVMREAS